MVTDVTDLTGCVGWDTYQECRADGEAVSLQLGYSLVVARGALTSAAHSCSDLESVLPIATYLAVANYYVYAMDIAFSYRVGWDDSLLSLPDQLLML